MPSGNFDIWSVIFEAFLFMCTILALIENLVLKETEEASTSVDIGLYSNLK